MSIVIESKKGEKVNVVKVMEQYWLIHIFNVISLLNYRELLPLKH